MIKSLRICLFVFTVLAAFAQPGSLDSSFGNNGLMVNDFGNQESITASAVQADGKIIFVGSDIISSQTQISYSYLLKLTDKSFPMALRMR